MAPSREHAHFAKGLMAYMGYISEQTSSRHDKKIARSPELKSFLLYLSGRAPLIMNRLLKPVSRKCEEALRVEKERQTGRKRPGPPARNESNAKRLRTVADETTVRRSAENDEEEEEDEEDVPMKTEKISPQSIVQSSAIAPSHASAPEKDEESIGENLEKQDPDTKPTENKVSNGAVRFVNVERDGDTVVQPTTYEIEFGLSSGSLIMENYVKTSLLALAPSTTRPSFDIHDEIDKTWRIIRLLDFYKTRRELYQHLENREKMPCGKLQARTTWDSSDPSEILDTLENVKRNTTDNKIHRAYGQTMLVQSVNAQVAQGYKSTVTGHRSDHTSLLEELARKKAGPVSKTEADQTIASYFYEYYAGRRWLGVIDWFGGDGIVLVFVIAGKSFLPSDTRCGTSNPFHLRDWILAHQKLDGISAKMRATLCGAASQHPRVGWGPWSQCS